MAALALVALAAGGCRDADGDHAVGAAHDLVAAMERGDGAAACELLSEAGVSELLLVAVDVRAEVPGLEAPEADRCALVASRLAEEATGLGDLLASPVSEVRVEGDRATVEVRAGAYEVEEIGGHWRVSRFEPLAHVLRGGPAAEEPVHLSVVAPKLKEPALGPALAGRTRDEVAELTGTLDPPDARLEAEAASPATTITDVGARDGRFRLRVELAPGRNDLLLSAEAAGRAPTELTVRLTLE